MPSLKKKSSSKKASVKKHSVKKHVAASAPATVASAHSGSSKKKKGSKKGKKGKKKRASGKAGMRKLGMRIVHCSGFGNKAIVALTRARNLLISDFEPICKSLMIGRAKSADANTQLTVRDLESAAKLMFAKVHGHGIDFAGLKAKVGKGKLTDMKAFRKTNGLVFSPGSLATEYSRGGKKAMGRTASAYFALLIQQVFTQFFQDVKADLKDPKKIVTSKRLERVKNESPVWRSLFSAQCWDIADSITDTQHVMRHDEKLRKRKQSSHSGSGKKKRRTSA